MAFHGNNDEVQTPVLDDLATRALVIDRYYAYRYCSPTRASLMTGHTPGHYIWETNPSLSDETGVRVVDVVVRCVGDDPLPPPFPLAVDETRSGASRRRRRRRAARAGFSAPTRPNADDYLPCARSAWCARDKRPGERVAHDAAEDAQAGELLDAPDRQVAPGLLDSYA